MPGPSANITHMTKLCGNCMLPEFFYGGAFKNLTEVIRHRGNKKCVMYVHNGSMHNWSQGSVLYCGGKDCRAGHNMLVCTWNTV